MTHLIDNLYKFHKRRVLVTSEESFSHVNTKEWGGDLQHPITLTRNKTELNQMDLICNVRGSLSKSLS